MRGLLVSIAFLIVAPKKSFLMLGGERTRLVLAVFGVGHSCEACFLLLSNCLWS